MDAGRKRQPAITLAARMRASVARIPRGRVATYGQIAALAGRPRAARQVARALGGGAGLPWHRVVAAGGRIALPGEAGWEQRLRLEREGVRFRGRRVRMDEHAWNGRRGRARMPALRKRGGLPHGRRRLTARTVGEAGKAVNSGHEQDYRAPARQNRR